MTVFKRVRGRLTYANVTASLALFVALGGTSYAVAQLPRNSVGAAQIRSSAVGSSEMRSRAVISRHIRDRSVALRDISPAARRRLSGQRGLTGPQGQAGPPGPAGVTYRAAVDSTGLLVRGNARQAGTGASLGTFLVFFPQPVEQCVATATLARNAGGSPEDPPAGRITVSHAGGDTIFVRTFDQNGTATQLPFNLIVAC